MTDSSFNKLVGSRINEIMIYKNISANILSSISGISKAQIYRVISGNCSTTLKTLHCILSSLGVSFESFFNFSLSVKDLFINNSQIPLPELLKLIARNLKIQQSKMSRLKSLTQERLAENLGQADYKYINYIFNGRNNSYINLKLSTLYNISKQLGIENEIHILFTNS